MSLLFFCWCCCLRLQVTRKKVLWLQIIAARNEENPRIISEKNLTLQCLVSAAIVSLIASLLTFELKSYPCSVGGDEVVPYSEWEEAEAVLLVVRNKGEMGGFNWMGGEVVTCR